MDFIENKGLLSNLFLSDNEYEMYGYYTATKLKIVLILTQKQNLSNYEERLIKQAMKMAFLYFN